MSGEHGRWGKTGVSEIRGSYVMIIPIKTKVCPVCHWRMRKEILKSHIAYRHANQAVNNRLIEKPVVSKWSIRAANGQLDRECDRAIARDR